MIDYLNEGGDGSGGGDGGAITLTSWGVSLEDGGPAGGQEQQRQQQQHGRGRAPQPDVA